ncbi:unnamed protein product [Clonostachys rosea]|uniref:Uncharacterized protein n=1 Tax=Bionectria ochroleuca TaxID=29856 RepID=A0ABY6U261_BIOOC|nr:unnamed protein product [Clonostachys rosea]
MSLEFNVVGSPGEASRLVRASRAGAPKVRTGCVTCESTCLTTRGICGGYYIKPRKNQSWRHRLPVEKKSSQACINVTQLAVGLSFEDDHQPMYFEEWRCLAAEPLSGFTSSKLWSTFMSQLTSQSAILRHAALGIGAMSHALSAQSMGDGAE